MGTGNRREMARRLCSKSGRCTSERYTAEPSQYVRRFFLALLPALSACQSLPVQEVRIPVAVSRGSGSHLRGASTTGILLSVAAVLAGCAHAPVQEVRIPVAVPCVQQVPDDPAVALPDSALSRLSDPLLILALREQQIVWRDHARELRALLLGCRAG